MAYHPTDLPVDTRPHQRCLSGRTAIPVLALLALLGEAAPAPALASVDVPLEGRWSYSYVGYSDSSKATYAGTVTVDAQGVATLTGTLSGNDPDRGPDRGTVAETGHVRVALPEVEFSFTEARIADGKPYDPDHFHCWASGRASDTLVCRNVDHAGRMTARFTLSRLETGGDAAPNVAAPPSRQPLPQLLKQEDVKPERLPQVDQSVAPATPPPAQPQPQQVQPQQTRPQQAGARPAAKLQQPQEMPLKPAEPCTVSRPKPGFQVYLVTCPTSRVMIGRTVDSPTGWTLSEGVNATEAINFFMKSRYAR
jgi:hypothetical protein